MSIIIRGMRKFGGVRMGQIFTKPQYDQYLYALEYYNSNPEKVYRINLSDGSETLLFEESLTQYHPEYAVSSDNIIYPAGYRYIKAYDGFTGNIITSTGNIVYRATTISKDRILYAMNATGNRLDVYDANDLSTILYSKSGINLNGSTTSYTYRSMDSNIEGNVYIGGSSDDNYIHKYDNTATSLWDYETQSVGTHYVGSTPDGGVVYVCNNVSNKTVTKLSMSGNFVWESSDLGNTFGGIAVDYDGNIYALSTTGYFFVKLDSNGNVIRTTTLGSSINPNDIECDLEGNVYVSCVDNTVRKFDQDGNELWSTTLPSTEQFYVIEVTGMSGSEKWG